MVDTEKLVFYYIILLALASIFLVIVFGFNEIGEYDFHQEEKDVLVLSCLRNPGMFYFYDNPSSGEHSFGWCVNPPDGYYTVSGVNVGSSFSGKGFFASTSQH